MPKYEGVAREQPLPPLPDVDAEPAHDTSSASPAIDVLGWVWAGFVLLAWLFSRFWFGGLGCTVNGFPGCEEAVSDTWVSLGLALPVMAVCATIAGALAKERWIGWVVWIALTLVWFVVGTALFGRIDYQPS